MAVPDKILKSPQLPSLPAAAVRLLELARDPESEIKEVVETIRTDPALAAKILKAANSSYFGFRSKVTSIDRAVPLLGTTVVTSLALGFSLTDETTPAGPMYEYYNAYWMQSLAQAAAADLLGKHGRTAVECEFFLAGLLADIGRLAMLKTIAKQYLPVLEAAEDGLRELHELEQEILGFDHIEVGLELMRSWELPEPLVLSAALHHADLEQLQAKADDSYASLLQAVATSAAIGEYFCGYGKGQALQRAKRFTQEFYGFSEEDLNEFIEQTSARIEEAGQLFSMNTSSIPDPSELLARANEQLAQLAMRAHVESQQAKARERSIEEEKKRLESENRELQQQAVHDPLTEVYNRRFFDETLSREIARARRDATPVALLFIDIDHFKQINDTYGHHCGDLVLQRVAKLINGMLRSSDVLARYGGEEFTILINQPTEKGIGKLAERIRQRVEQEEIIVEGQRIPVTVSIGAAIALPQRHETDLASRLVAAADEAMYDSKRGGRNQVHVRSLIQEPERRLMQRVTQHRFSRWLVDRGLFDIPTVSKALAYCRPEPVRIGQLAQQHGYLTDAEVEQILQSQESTGERFGAAAVRLGLLREDELVHLLAQQREDAAKLARTLVQMGLLDQRRAEALLREYITERSPRRVAGPIATPAQAR